MVPVLGREVEEGEQSFPVLRQAGDRLVVPGAVLVGKHVNGVGLTETDDGGIFQHGVSLLSGRFWQASHPPRYAAVNQSSSPRFLLSSVGLAPTGKAPPCHGARRKRTFPRYPAPNSPSTP